MTLARFSPILLLLALAGCCGPAISGRYCDVGQPQAAACGCETAHASRRCLHGGSGLVHGNGAMLHRPLLAGLFGMNASSSIPAEQHADYLSPLAKFHPVPTRPVFESLPAHGPPLLLDASHSQAHLMQ